MGIIWDAGNPVGKATGVFIDEADDTFTFVEREDCEPFILANKRFKNSGMDGYTPSRDMRHAASIPPSILNKWYLEEGIKWWDSCDTPKLMEKLDDPEWEHLRTSTGHLGKRPFRKFFRGSNSPNRIISLDEA